jgi:hypothetical protein
VEQQILPALLLPILQCIDVVSALSLSCCLGSISSSSRRPLGSNLHRVVSFLSCRRLGSELSLSRCHVVLLAAIFIVWSCCRLGSELLSSCHPFSSNLCCIISSSTQQQTLLVLGAARCHTLSMHTHHWKVRLTTQNHDTVQHSGLNITKKQEIKL